MGTKCIKLILKNIDNNIDKIFRNFQYLAYKASNKAMTYYYNQDINNELLQEFNKTIDCKKLVGKSFDSWIEDKMKELMPDFGTANVAQTRQNVALRYKSDKKNGLLKGNRTLSTFKRDNPLIIHNKNYIISKNAKGFEVELRLFSKKYQKENNIKCITLNIDKIDGSKKSILNNLINKEYKQGSAQIQKNSKGKWELIISFSFENEKKELNYNKVLGVDLGITNVATMQIYNTKSEQYEWLSYKECMISGKELIHYRQQIEARKKELSIASKYCGGARVGHGYETRMKPVNNIGDKINRFKDTYNHKISRYIVDFAIKHNCGNIQMEDLSGFSNQQNESLLRNWSYYDLQNKIKYKAEEVGIIINLILPHYTSLRCNNCGFIDYENRDCKNNQAKFECIKCYHGKITENNKNKVNADINAARNIAMPNIEYIIKEQLEVQSKFDDRYVKMYNSYIKTLNDKDKRAKSA